MKAALTFEFLDAGHVLGSAGILLRAEGRTIFYTGDVNFDDQTIMQVAVFPRKRCRCSDHGIHSRRYPMPVGLSRESEEERLAAAIDARICRAVACSFRSLRSGKTQEALGDDLRISPPEILRISGLHRRTEHEDDGDLRSPGQSNAAGELPRLQLPRGVAPFVLNGQTIGDAPARPGRVYALSSGMMTPKTLSNIFARRVLEVRSTRSFLSATLIPESPGGNFALRQKRRPHFARSWTNRRRTLRCNIEQFQFSAHASRESIVAYVKSSSPKKSCSCTAIRRRWNGCGHDWRRRYRECEVIVPTPGVEIEL